MLRYNLTVNDVYLLQDVFKIASLTVYSADVSHTTRTKKFSIQASFKKHFGKMYFPGNKNFEKKITVCTCV